MANPNPSPATRFGGERENPRNPGGKTPEQHALDMDAASKAAELRRIVLSTALERLERGEDALEVLDANLRNVMKDSEDRAHGTPKATTQIDADITHRDAVDMTDEELAAIAAAGSD